MHERPGTVATGDDKPVQLRMCINGKMGLHLHTTSCRYGTISGPDEADRIEILFYAACLLTGYGKNFEGAGEVENIHIIKNENTD